MIYRIMLFIKLLELYYHQLKILVVFHKEQNI
nr:MAG TPA: hypothetical protein [Siphoviridae sp. ctza41]